MYTTYVVFWLSDALFTQSCHCSVVWFPKAFKFCKC